MSQAVYISDGDSVAYTPGSAVTGGNVVVVNGITCVARKDIAANVQGALVTEGVFDFVKDSSNFSADKTAVYWDADGDPVGGTAGTGAATTTSSGNTFIGYSVGTAGVSATTVRAKLVEVPATVTVAGALTTAITDPGNAGAIPVTKSGYCPIVTAGSETRTLAAPSFIGQQLLLYIKTDGGTCVITVASAINQTGNNTITMADVRDVIKLVAIESGSNKVWHVESNDGAALSTV